MPAISESQRSVVLTSTLLILILIGLAMLLNYGRRRRRLHMLHRYGHATRQHASSMRTIVDQRRNRHGWRLFGGENARRWRESDTNVIVIQIPEGKRPIMASHVTRS